MLVVLPSQEIADKVYKDWQEICMSEDSEASFSSGRRVNGVMGRDSHGLLQPFCGAEGLACISLFSVRGVVFRQQKARSQLLLCLFDHEDLVRRADSFVDRSPITRMALRIAVFSSFGIVPSLLIWYTSLRESTTLSYE